MPVAERNPAAAPINQTEFYRHYFPYVCRFVMKYGGIQPQDAEDVANSIWVRLLARDVLSQFDPDHVIVHNGVQYKAKFKSYLDKMLDLYVRHYRAQQHKRMQREVCLGVEDADLFELLLGQTDDTKFYEQLEESLMIDKIVAYLVQLPSRINEVTFERLFLAVVAQARFNKDGALHKRQLQEALGINQGQLKTMLLKLQEHISAALEGREPPETTVLPRHTRMVVGGVQVGLPDLQKALDVLRNCASNMIKQPLATAGHPLAVCDYHAVCREHRAEHTVPVSKPRHAEKDAFMAALAQRISMYYVA